MSTFQKKISEAIDAPNR